MLDDSLLFLLSLGCLRLKRLGSSFLKFMWCDAWSNLPAKAKSNMKKMLCSARGQTSLITSCLDNPDLAYLLGPKEKALIVLYA